MIDRGAEAVIKESGDRIIKKRPTKEYRHESIDRRLRSERTNRETRILRRCHQHNVNVPSVKNKEDFIIEMENIDGKKLRDSPQTEYFRKAGCQVAKMHECKVFHSDISSSNIMVSDDRVFLIDFGMSKISERAEDRAVDINLFKQNIQSFHSNPEEQFQEFKEGYSSVRGRCKALKQTKKIDSRKRYL
jgi:Kae1-associated kinase Bud32